MAFHELDTVLIAEKEKGWPDGVPVFVIDDVQRMFTKSGGAGFGFLQVPPRS